MFCPKCGHPISKDDNFCSSCGANIKNVHVKFLPNDENITSKGDTNKVKKISEETRVFNPKSLDGIDTTDDIKNIIAQVDKKVSKNIENYKKENSKSKSNDEEIKKEAQKIEKPKSSKKTKVAEESKDYDEYFKISQSELVRRVQEELKKSNFDENNLIENKEEDLVEKDNIVPDPEEKKESKKFSLKEKWHNFINEDDDEFSIFSKIKDDPKSSEEVKKEITDPVNTSKKNFENTLSTPKITVSDINNNILEEKKSETPKSVKKEEKNSEVESYIKKERKKIKDFFSFNKNNEEKNKNKVTENATTKIDLDKEIEKSNKETVLEDKPKKEKSIESFHKLSEDFKGVFDFFEKITTPLSNYIKEIGSNESKIVIGIGVLLTAISLVLGNHGFSPILIIFLVLRILFDYVEFYVPLNLATDRDDIDTSYDEVKFNSLITWIICKVVLFIGFIVSPFGGLFHYTELAALTAMPVATLVLITIAPIISITLYRKHFIGRSKINFIGWYSIAFILFELLFKMIWFIINFIFVTLF
ncbi:zinc-ribbon domain-containing protein [Peptoniphilus sp. MSJ-1]|uniref:Zinc-ribbon domain-containing protein n=1 Tax=Peptoniphilus ovalis TaxID=2841503 RepID=A0ABS6FJH6_9FIRM|nr:zinc-ribbon domain-containing protein [Peptoniphilus ovalis]MBU5669360.1 zinc-ribbon domain-containing protein [Peptoniphilus ovalis]